MKAVDKLRGMMVDEVENMRGYGPVRTVVVKGKNFVCSRCVFGDSCKDARDCQYAGACMGHVRPDGCSVMFKRA